MEYQSCVLLYSNYSPLSQQLLTALKSCPIDLAEIKMDSLCVDNEKIRKKILSAKNINISVVPSILVIFTNGIMKKHEGKSVFEWLEKMVASRLPPPPPPPLPPPPQPPSQSSEQEDTSVQKSAHVPLPPKEKRQNKGKKSKVVQRVEQSSNIDDLDSLDEDEEKEELDR